MEFDSRRQSLITWRSILSLLLPVLLAACGTAPEQKKPELPSLDEMLARVTEQDGGACITVRDMEGHRVVGDGVISVGTHRGDHYLVTTVQSCRFMGNSSGTIVSDSWGTFCRGTGTIVDHGRTCMVRHVYEFPSSEAAMAALKVAQARREAQELIPDHEP
jgi:hypothetical protein